MTRSTLAAAVSLLAACAAGSPRAALAPTHPLPVRDAAPPACRLEPLFDVSSDRVGRIAVALTPEAALVAFTTSGVAADGGPELRDGRTVLVDLATRARREARPVREGASVVAASRGRDAWVAWYESGAPTLVAHPLPSEAPDDVTLSIVGNLDALAVADDGALWLAFSNAASEEGTPFGSLARITAAGDSHAVGDRAADAPYLGLLARPGGRMLVVRRAFGRLRLGDDRERSLRTLDAALAQTADVPLAAPLETCMGDARAYSCPVCYAPLALGDHLVVACEDGVVHDLDASGADDVTFLHRRVVASGVVAGRLLLVTGGEDFVAPGVMELAIESPPGTTIGRLRRRHSLDEPVAGPEIASAGDAALVAWADADAAHAWHVHARLVRCR